MTSSLQEVVDGSGTEQHGREYLILVLKVFKVQQVIQDQRVHRVLLVLKVQPLLLVLRVLLVHRVLQELKVLLELMVHRVHKV